MCSVAIIRMYRVMRVPLAPDRAARERLWLPGRHRAQAYNRGVEMGQDADGAPSTYVLLQEADGPAQGGASCRARKTCASGPRGHERT